MFTEAAILPVILEGTRLHVGLLVALFVAVGAWVLMTRTRHRLRDQGRRPGAAAAARFAGFGRKRIIWLRLLLGGGLAGLAGMFEVAGPDRPADPAAHPRLRLHRDHRGLPRPAAPARHRPRPGLLDGALLHRRRERPGRCRLPQAVTGVFQGMLLFFLLASDFLVRYRVRIGRRRAGRSPRMSLDVAVLGRC